MPISMWWRKFSAGCGASGWCLGVLQIHSWVAGLLSQQAQDDIYGDDQDTLIVAVLNARGEAVRGGNGYRVSGFLAVRVRSDIPNGRYSAPGC